MGPPYISISFSASVKMKNELGAEEKCVSRFMTTLQNQFLPFYPAKNAIG
jgi:hypothetical protein